MTRKWLLYRAWHQQNSTFPLLHNNLIHQINNLNTFKNEETFIFLRNA